MDQKVHVIFSSIKPPSQTIVHESLLALHSKELIHVITSKKHFPLWADLGYKVQIVQFDSTSTTRIQLRKLLIRSKFLRQALRVVLKHIARNGKQVLMPPHNARHFEYIEALNKLPDEDWAFLVDSRDLIFQVSPEEILDQLERDNYIHLFLENGKSFKDGSDQTNDKSPANWKWASQLLNFRSNELSRLVGTDIVNSGCIAGRVRELRFFFEKSCNLMTNSLYSSFALLDQAATNVLAYDPAFDLKVQLHTNGKIVLNMCGVIDERIEITHGKLLRLGKVVPVIHQFDRFGTWKLLTGLVLDKREYRVQ